MRYEINWIRKHVTVRNGCLCRSWGGAIRDHSLCGRDGRKCFGLTRGKCQIFVVNYAFLDKIIGTGRNCKL